MAWTDSELPPRARRIPYAQRQDRPRDGTTSACAENTWLGLERLYSIWNYLRMRGEYKPAMRFRYRASELPPHARRIHSIPIMEGSLAGTTSACAENTLVSIVLGPEVWNYLRMRGEYLDTAQAMAKHVELPPHARRIHWCGFPAVHSEGTTSACAENTSGAKQFQGATRNYLRMRGEYSMVAWTPWRGSELPPHARRIQLHRAAFF